MLPVCTTQASSHFLQSPTAVSTMFCCCSCRLLCNFIGVIDTGSVHALLYGSPDLIVDKAQLGAVCRPEIMSDKVEVLRCSSWMVWRARWAGALSRWKMNLLHATDLIEASKNFYTTFIFRGQDTGVVYVKWLLVRFLELQFLQRMKIGTSYLVSMLTTKIS